MSLDRRVRRSRTADRQAKRAPPAVAPWSEIHRRLSRVKLHASSLGRRVDGRTLTLRRLLALTQETQWHAKYVVQNLDSNSADHSQRTQRERSTDVQGQWIDPGHAFRRLELKSKFGPCTDKISVSVNVKAIPLRRREKRRADAASQNGISFCDLKVIHMRYRSLINWNIMSRFCMQRSGRGDGDTK